MEKHLMICEVNRPGYQVWFCEICGRRVEVDMVNGISVLLRGDQEAQHFGSTGLSEAPVEDVRRLAPFEKFMQEKGL
jgi:hypothetical protein